MQVIELSRRQHIVNKRMGIVRVEIDLNSMSVKDSTIVYPGQAQLHHLINTPSLLSKSLQSLIPCTPDLSGPKLNAELKRLLCTQHPSYFLFCEMRKKVDSSMFKYMRRYICNMKRLEVCMGKNCSHQIHKLLQCSSGFFCRFSGQYHLECMQKVVPDCQQRISKQRDYCPSCEQDRLNGLDTLKRMNHIIALSDDPTHQTLSSALLTACVYFNL